MTNAESLLGAVLKNASNTNNDGHDLLAQRARKQNVIFNTRQCMWSTDLQYESDMKYDDNLDDDNHNHDHDHDQDQDYEYHGETLSKIELANNIMWYFFKNDRTQRYQLQTQAPPALPLPLLPLSKRDQQISELPQPQPRNKRRRQQQQKSRSESPPSRTPPDLCSSDHSADSQSLSSSPAQSPLPPSVSSARNIMMNVNNNNTTRNRTHTHTHYESLSDNHNDNHHRRSRSSGRRRSRINNNNRSCNSRVVADELSSLVSYITDGCVYVFGVGRYQPKPSDKRGLYFLGTCTHDLARLITADERWYFSTDDGKNSHRCLSLYKYLQCIFKCQLNGREVRHVRYKYDYNNNNSNNNNQQVTFVDDILVFHTNLKRESDAELLYFIAVQNGRDFNLKYRIPKGNVESYLVTKTDLINSFGLDEENDIPRPTIFNFYTYYHPFDNNERDIYRDTDQDGRGMHRFLLNHIQNQTMDIDYCEYEDMLSNIQTLCKTYNTNSEIKDKFAQFLPMQLNEMPEEMLEMYIEECVVAVDQAFDRIRSAQTLTDLETYVTRQVFMNKSGGTMHVEMIVPVCIDITNCLNLNVNNNNSNNNNGGNRNRRRRKCQSYRPIYHQRQSETLQYFAVVVRIINDTWQNTDQDIIRLGMQKLHPLQFAYENARLLNPVHPDSLLYQYYIKELLPRVQI